MATQHASETELGRAVQEIEQHVAADGWDQPPRLYALADGDELLRRAPELAAELGLEPSDTAEPTLIPIEQELPETSLEDLLATISWPEGVVGAALAVERIVLPTGVEESIPEHADMSEWAQQHPERADVRIVAAALRDGPTASVLRVRGHEADSDLIRDPEFTPDLGQALAATLAE
jgi:hypothetical protein